MPIPLLDLVLSGHGYRSTDATCSSASLCQDSEHLWTEAGFIICLVVSDYSKIFLFCQVDVI